MRDVADALRESEERFRTLFDQAPIGLMTYDRDLRITDCNLALCDIIGRPYEQLVGLDMHRLRDQRPLSAIERVFEGETTSYAGPYHTGAGLLREVRSRFSPLRDAEGEVVGGIGLIEDVSERVRADHALRDFQQRLAHAVTASPLGVILWNPDFEVTEWNASATRIFGWTAEEAIGKSADFIVPEDARAQVSHVWKELGSRRGGERSTNANVTKSGKRILCDWYNAPLLDSHGQVAAVASIVDDVTERKRALDALEHSEARFRALIELAPDAIGVFREFRWVYVNPSMVRVFGYSRADEMVGHDVLALVHPDDVQVGRRALQSRAEGAPPQPREYRMRRRDGSDFVAEIVTMRIEYDGEPALLGFARDVTERKQMQLRLLQADRMASVGTLAAGVAHEINNPLAYLLANLDVVVARKLPEIVKRLSNLGEVLDEDSRGELAGAVESLGTIQEMLDIAREGAGRVRAIVRDLKTFSRAGDERRGPVDVQRVVDASISMAWNQIRHVGRLEKDYAKVPPVAASESRLGQVFLNLLVNAAQALDARRSDRNVIRVRVRVDPPDAPSDPMGSSDSLPPDQNVVVEVEDTGSGMSNEVAARIFDPFFTTKTPGEGTGLGLWICKGILDGLGGAIDVRSEPGVGSCFSVRLPAWRPAALEPVVTRAAPIQVAARRGRILVVDDEPAVARVLRAALQEDHEVVAASSGAEAREILRSDDAFDLLLCDLMMPEVSGIDLHTHLQASGSSLAERMIFVTGGAFTARAREFLANNSPPRIDKPFDVEQIRAYVREAIATGVLPTLPLLNTEGEPS